LSKLINIFIHFYFKILYYPQFEINKKRDTELTKLRRLLEDVHIESEETAHLLRKKHQEVVSDFQEQLDQLAKAKARYNNFYRVRYKKITLYFTCIYKYILFPELKKKKPNSNKKFMNYWHKLKVLTRTK